MSKIVVVGAGASGIIAALKASEKHDVILVDGNDKIGKKILLTGNGRCNYWNEDIDIKNYHTDNKLALDNILSHGKDVLLYLKKLCIFPKVKNGYYYPYSNQASSIREIFARAINSSTVEFIPNFKVINIDKIDNIFVVDNSEIIIRNFPVNSFSKRIFDIFNLNFIIFHMTIDNNFNLISRIFS